MLIMCPTSQSKLHARTFHLVSIAALTPVLVAPTAGAVSAFRKPKFSSCLGEPASQHRDSASGQHAAGGPLRLRRRIRLLRGLQLRGRLLRGARCVGLTHRRHTRARSHAPSAARARMLVSRTATTKSTFRKPKLSSCLGEPASLRGHRTEWQECI